MSLTPTYMLRRALSLMIAFVLSLHVLAASAVTVQYNANIGARAVVTTPRVITNQQRVCLPADTSAFKTQVYFSESPYEPGGPFLGKILNNWMYWGNIFNWAPTGCAPLVTTYGRYTTGNTWGYGATTAAYVPNTSASQSSQALYVDGTSAPSVASATYTEGQQAAPAMQAGYTAPKSDNTAMVANYTASPSATPVVDAQYVSTTSSNTPVQATYTSAQNASTAISAEYRAPATQPAMAATYQAPVVQNSGTSAAYQSTDLKTRSSSTLAQNIPWYGASSSRSSSNSALWSLERNLPGGAGTNTRTSTNSTLAQNIPWYGTSRSSSSSDGALWSLERNLPGASTFTEGAAFGSLFGDGRDAAFGGNAIESFVARVQNQTAPTYTYRAGNVAQGNYSDAIAVDPVQRYDIDFDVPLVQASTYEADLLTMEAYGLGIVTAQWKKQSPKRAVTRMNMMNLALAVRQWRTTGQAPTAATLSNEFLTSLMVDQEGNAIALPRINDVAATDSRYPAIALVGMGRLMYMPNMLLEKQKVISFTADPESSVQRAQALQTIMTALYLRPDTSILRGGYADLAPDAWYTPWALTARTYGLNYGERFNASAVVTQEEAAHMVATLLKQLR